MTAATSHTVLPFLPPEIWLDILSYLDDPIFLWRTCRLVSQAIRACTESVFRNYWIAKCTVLEHYIPANYLKRGAFSHFSSDRRIAYFSISGSWKGTLLEDEKPWCYGPTWLYITVKRTKNWLSESERTTVHVVSDQIRRASYPVEFVHCEYGDSGSGEDTNSLADARETVVGIDWQLLIKDVISRSRRC